MAKIPRTPAEIAADARRTGRPPIPRRSKKDRVIQIRVSGAELQAIHAEAQRRGVTVTDMLLGSFRRAGR
jgi:hypothetical protein